MIEFISTPEQVLKLLHVIKAFLTLTFQIQTIIYALQDRVVALIQDLNGNHVIQKCLNRLSAEDAQVSPKPDI